MRREEMVVLNKPYDNSKQDYLGSRFQSSIGADIPSASKLAQEII